MTDAPNRGREQRDSRSCLLLQRERAGLRIEVPREKIQAMIDRDG